MSDHGEESVGAIDRLKCRILGHAKERVAEFSGGSYRDECNRCDYVEVYNAS